MAKGATNSKPESSKILKRISLYHRFPSPMIVGLDRISFLCQVAERVGVFAKLPTNAKSWVRRLQLLDGLDHALHVCGSKATQKDAFKIILLIAEDGTKPATWWTRNADIALMVGVYRHGYANYDAVRVDAEVGYGAGYGTCI